MSEQKMREALEAAYEAHKDDFEQPWLSLAAEALATPADEQVDLTDEEMALAVLPLCQNYQIATELVDVSRDEYRAVIAAHEAKRRGAA